MLKDDDGKFFLRRHRPIEHLGCRDISELS